MRLIALLHLIRLNKRRRRRHYFYELRTHVLLLFELVFLFLLMVNKLNMMMERVFIECVRVHFHIIRDQLIHTVRQIIISNLI